MQFSWTTFFIEIINFLILVWILKRFFYMPIKNAIKKREQSIQETLNQANQLKNEAEASEKKYENRLKDWDREKATYKKDFEDEMVELKNKELAKLNKDLEAHKAKDQAMVEHQLKQQMKGNIREAMTLASNFSTTFLKQFTDVALEKKIIELFIKNIDSVSQDQVDQLIEQLPEEAKIQVQTAYVLNQDEKELISSSFEKRIKKKLNFNYTQNPDLLAGINVQVGSVSLHANLRDELKFFTEVASGSIQI